MARFRYVALNEELKLVRSEHEEEDGYLEVPDRTMAMTSLHTRGLRPVLVEEIKRRGLNLNLNFNIKWWVGLSDLEMFCRVLQILLPAGITVLEALDLLVDEMENPRLQKDLRVVADDVRNGKSFAASLRRFPKTFPPVMLATVAAGEGSGTLEKALEHLADMLQRAAQLRRELTSALIYPICIVLVFIGMISTFMILTPRLLTSLVDAQKMADVRHRLPASIKLCLWMKENPWAWSIPIAIILTPVVLFLISRKWPALRLALAKLVRKFPFIGKIVLYFGLARMIDIFVLLEDAGVEPIPALRTLGPSTGHAMIEDAMVRVIERVRKGVPRYAAISAEPVFPGLMKAMWHSGERAGSVTKMVRQVGEFFFLSASATTKQMVTMIEPTMIVGIAFVVGPFIVGMYQALQLMMKNVG